MKRKLFCIGMCIALIVTLMPTAAFAAQTGAMQGVIAVASENDTGDQIEYTYSPQQEEIMRLPYSTSWWYSYGTDHAGNFEGAKDITEAEIIIEKDGKQLGRKKFSLEKEIVTEGEIPGIYYSIWHDEKNGKLTSIDYSFHFGLDLDAYKHLTTLAGTYAITVNWVVGGQNYTASTQYILKPGQAISEISPAEDAGVIERIWSNGSDFGNSMTYTYNPLVSYANPTTDGEAEGEREIVQRYIFTDCDYNGFFNFDRCVTEGLGNVFTKGDTIKYDADTELTPLYIHPRFITEDMVGKSATLIFKNGETEEAVTIKIEKEANTSLVEGKLYVVNSWDVQSTSETSDTVRIFCGDGGYTLSDLLETEIQLPMDESSNITFVTYQNQTLHQVNVAELSETDAAFLNMTYSETNGVKNYRLTPLQCGDVNIKAPTGNAGAVQCHISLPEIGFYHTAERTGETFIRDGFHYKKATEKKADGTEAYVYLITPTYGYTAEQIKVSCGGWNAKTDAWEEKSIDGIAIGTPTVQNLDGEAYAIYKIAISQSYRNPGQNEVSFRIVYNNGENISTKELHIYDSEEILENEQLYWFYDDWVMPDKSGKLQLKDGVNGTLHDYAVRQEDWGRKNGILMGYFAVKQGEDFYAVQNVTLKEIEGMTLEVSNSSKEPYLYTITWSKFGRYHFAADVDGKDYLFILTAQLPDIGFYNTAVRSEDSCIGNELHFIYATERNEAGTEAYFYLIAPTNGYEASQIKLSYGIEAWDETLQEGSWIEKQLPDGIRIEEPVTKKFNETSYLVWRIAVSNEYKDEEVEQSIRISYAENESMHYEVSLHIYDAAEIAQTQQLYWFWGDVVTVGTNGRLQIDGDQEFTLEDCAFSVFRFVPIEEVKQTYFFAVRKNNGFYVVEPKSAAPQVILERQQDGSYTVCVNQLGNYRLQAEDDGETYYMQAQYRLPEEGFFASEQATAENYLYGACYLPETTAKSNDGKETYFYLRCNTKDMIGNELYFWKDDAPVTKAGISLTRISTQEDTEKGYTVWNYKITLTDTYQIPETGYDEITITVGNKRYCITIYDASRGDLDRNGKVDFADALYLKRHTALWPNYQSINKGPADLNRDGKVSLQDLMILERHVASWKDYEKLPKVS